MFGLYWSLGCLIAFAFTIYILLRPIIRGAIYFPTSTRHIELIAEMLRKDRAKGTTGREYKVADIGSGDGRILFALARDGMEAHGYEIGPFLVWRSRRAIRRLGLGGRASVQWKDFWRVNLAPFDAVVVYGYPPIMKGLGEKLRRELRPGTAVISNIYHIPDWKPAEKVEQVYRYEAPG